jgi:trimeric autotransporter adhesin
MGMAFRHPNPIRQMFSSSKFLLPACAVWSIGTSFAGEKVSTADAQSLIKACENARQEFRTNAESKPSAYNKKQNWVTQLDQQGFIVNPRGRDWTWGLGLKSWGAAGSEKPVASQTLSGYQTQGNRVTYGHSGQLEEWFLNDQRGLEHGFTVKEKPAGDAQALDFRMSVRGSLKAKLDGDHVEFVDASGAERLKYSGLKAWDANGKVLATNFKVDQNDLVIRVDSANAAYPITVDPLAEDPVAQEAYIKAENAGITDYFGYSVAISGNLAVVGTPYEDSSATGIDGDDGDSTTGKDSGAVYVFLRTDGTWKRDAYIKPSATTTLDYFGSSVDVYDNGSETAPDQTIVVGAYGKDSSSLSFSGAAYVFTFDTTNNKWVQKSVLKAPVPYVSGYFGFSVAIHGDRLVVGAPGESSKSTIINGDGTDHSAANAGAAYVYERGRTGTWAYSAYLKPTLNAAGNQFGYSVGLSEDTILSNPREAPASILPARTRRQPLPEQPSSTPTPALPGLSLPFSNPRIQRLQIHLDSRWPSMATSQQ